MAQIGIFVGTVYGNALLTAEEVGSILELQGHRVTLFENCTLEQWSRYSNDVVLVITSTTSQGSLPGNIMPLFLQMKSALDKQVTLSYGIIALGDSSYDSFCSAGHSIDALLQDHGAMRVGTILEIDATQYQDPEVVACHWAKQWGKLL